MSQRVRLSDGSQCEVVGLTGDGWMRRAVAVRAAGGAGGRRKLEEKGSQSVNQLLAFPTQFKSHIQFSQHACEGRGSTGGVYGCSKCTLPVYHMLSASSTSSQRSENTPKTACCRLLRQAARAQAQERERVDACAHTQARPTRRGLQAPHRRQVVMECGGNSHLLCRSRASSSPCRRSAAAAGRSAKSCSGSGVAR